MEPSRDAVWQALGKVIDPELRRPVTELDMVREVRIDGGAVAVKIALTVAGCDEIAAALGIATDPATLAGHDPREAIARRLAAIAADYILGVVPDALGQSLLLTAPLPRHIGVAKPVLSKPQRRAKLVRRALAARGFNEAVSFSFLARDQAALFGGGGSFSPQPMPQRRVMR